MKTYAEKLRDPLWLCKRDEIIAIKENRCQECGEEGLPLEVHHVIYLRGLDPWEYPNELMLCVCRECHFNRQIEEDSAHLELARLLAKQNRHYCRAVAKAFRLHIDQEWRKPVYCVETFLREVNNNA